MPFTKIKRTSEGEIVLAWTDTHDGVQTLEHRLTSRDEPRPAFTDALQAFADLIREAYGLAAHAELDVRGVTLTEHPEMGRGVVVTALLKLSLCPAPAVLNTPHVSEVGGDGETPIMPQPWIWAIDRLVRAADDYRRGKRAQRDLFEEAA